MIYRQAQGRVAASIAAQHGWTDLSARLEHEQDHDHWISALTESARFDWDGFKRAEIAGWKARDEFLHPARGSGSG